MILVHARIASVVMAASMLGKSCLVRFMSLCVANCFDAECLLPFWHVSLISRHALKIVCAICCASARIACMLVFVHYCLVWGGVVVCGSVKYVVGAVLGPCVLGNWVPWGVVSFSFSCLILCALSCSDHLRLPPLFWAVVFSRLPRGHSMLLASLWRL